VNIGSAVLEKQGMPIKTYLPGSVFGAAVMLGIDKVYPGALIASALCHVLIIGKNTYTLALEQYPSAIAHQMLNKHEKEASAALQVGARKIATKRILWRRYQWMMANSTLLTGAEMLLSMLKGWRQKVKDRHEWVERKEVEQKLYNSMMDHWWEKHLENQEQVAHKKHTADVLKHNVGRQCPPIFPKVKGSNVRFWMGQAPSASSVPRKDLRCSSSAAGNRSGCSPSLAAGPSSLPATPLPQRPNGSQSPDHADGLFREEVRGARSPSACDHISNFSFAAQTYAAPGTARGAGMTPSCVPCAGLVRNVMWSARARSPSTY